jgi:hypothetical protein
MIRELFSRVPHFLREKGGKLALAGVAVTMSGCSFLGAGGGKSTPAPDVAQATANFNTLLAQQHPVLTDEAQRTFLLLRSAYQDSRITETQLDTLSLSAGEPGVMGEAEAVLAYNHFEQLSPDDQKAFLTLLSNAPSQAHQGYLWKALGAGNSVGDISTFASAIAGIDAAALPQRLSTSQVAALFSGATPGSTDAEQYDESCAQTSAQVAGEDWNPVDALKAQTLDQDPSHGNYLDPPSVNPFTANQQADWLSQVGGVALPRGQGGTGTAWDAIGQVFDNLSPQTDYSYTYQEVNPNDPAAVKAGLDEVVAELKTGIEVPLGVTNSADHGGHVVLAEVASGPAADPTITLYDPWPGAPTQLKESALVSGTWISGWDRIEGFGVATPLDANVPNWTATGSS